MKKYFVIITFSLMTLVLFGCNKTKEIFSEKDLENYTISRTATNAYEGYGYTLAKNGANYSYQVGEEAKKYFIDYGTECYQYKTVTTVVTEDDTSTEDVNEEVTREDVVSVLSEYDFSIITSTLLSLNKEDFHIDGNNYNFKNLVKNSKLSIFMKDIYLDAATKLKEAYDREFVTLTSAKIVVADSKPQSLEYSLTYAKKEIKVTYQFSSYASTVVDMLNENLSSTVYAAKFIDKSPVITLNFKGYGKIEVKLFVADTMDKNTANYFIYLLKSGYYTKAKVDAKPNGEIFFGDNTKKALDSTVASDKTPAVSNKRGTLAMVLVQTDSNDKETITPQLVLNFTNNATEYDALSYTPIGGVISGFSVMDALEGISAEEFANIKVSISIKYNGYTYLKPTFK